MGEDPASLSQDIPDNRAVGNLEVGTGHDEAPKSQTNYYSSAAPVTVIRDLAMDIGVEAVRTDPQADTLRSLVDPTLALQLLTMYAGLTPRVVAVASRP